MSPAPLPDDAPRIGLGWDRHRMEAGLPCVLGGMAIEAPAGPAGHSDGDAVLHALTDAVLGGAGLDDLGTLFPDTDPQWKGANSATFLMAAVEEAGKAGLRVASADLAVICDHPRIGPHRAAIRARLAEWLGLPAERVNIKGKTTEDTGDAAVLEVSAVVLLVAARG